MEIGQVCHSRLFLGEKLSEFIVREIPFGQYVCEKKREKRKKQTGELSFGWCLIRSSTVSVFVLTVFLLYEDVVYSRFRIT